MGHRLSKIYTRTGDAGTTGLGDGTRVPKTHARIEAYGTVDEANSAIGMVLAVPGLPESVQSLLTRIQHELFEVGSELAVPGYRVITQAHIDALEQALDALNEPLPPLKEFILPSGGPATSACHLARTIVRRAERAAWQIVEAESSASVSSEQRQTDSGQAPGVSSDTTKYLNRLSDLLFVVARVLVRHERGAEVMWARNGPK